MNVKMPKWQWTARLSEWLPNEYICNITTAVIVNDPSWSVEFINVNLILHQAVLKPYRISYAILFCMTKHTNLKEH